TTVAPAGSCRCCWWMPPQTQPPLPSPTPTPAWRTSGAPCSTMPGRELNVHVCAHHELGIGPRCDSHPRPGVSTPAPTLPSTGAHGRGGDPHHYVLRSCHHHLEHGDPGVGVVDPGVRGQPAGRHDCAHSGPSISIYRPDPRIVLIV